MQPDCSVHDKQYLAGRTLHCLNGMQQIKTFLHL